MADMKETIAKAAVDLIMEGRSKKITVKDIVDKCHITRQTFYYHFEDIPHLIEWILERGIENLRKEAAGRRQYRAEENFRYVFLLALNTKPYVEKALSTNYSEEIERLVKEHIYYIFRQIIEEEELFPGLEEKDLELVVRYHSQAVIGILKDWSPKDDKNTERIIHTIFMIMEGKIAPAAPKETSPEPKKA